MCDLQRLDPFDPRAPDLGFMGSQLSALMALKIKTDISKQFIHLKIKILTLIYF